MLVDLPGYGYAKASKSSIHAWTTLIRDYLRGRVGLRRICLLIDARHGIKPSDIEIMDMLDKAAVPYQVVLTKADKVSAPMLRDGIAEIAAILKRHPAAMPEILASSARTGAGIPEIRAALSAVATAAPLV
jgi:GTP-binding protein